MGEPLVLQSHNMGTLGIKKNSRQTEVKIFSKTIWVDTVSEYQETEVCVEQLTKHWLRVNIRVKGKLG